MVGAGSQSSIATSGWGLLSLLGSLSACCERVADDDRPKVGDCAASNDNKRRGDGRGNEARSPQDQRSYPSMLEP